MEEQEREYLMENARRIRQWEDTPAAPSGRFSDMTEMEKDKLLDYLFDQNGRLTDQLAGVREDLRLQREQAERHHRDLKASLDRMEERAVAAEDRAKAAEKRAEMEADARARAEKQIEELTRTIESIMDTSLIEELRNQVTELSRQRDDALASDRHNRAERYGRTSQKMKDTGASDNDEDDRDAEEEKADMGGKDSVGKLPEENGDHDNEGGQDEWTSSHYNQPRENRQGKKHNTLGTDETLASPCDKDGIPEGWTVIRHYKRSVVDTITRIFGHEIEFLICSDSEGNIKVLHQPEGCPDKRWVRDAKSVKDAIRQIKNGPVLYDDGEPLVDCVPGTSATAATLADVAVQHYVNNVPFYRLGNYYRDCGLRSVRQTLINWVDKGAIQARPLIEALMDLAIERDSVVNCDETWCKVRINGKYRKRYTWCLVNRESKIVIYCYRKGARSRKALKDILGDRLPMAMQTDGYNVYMYLDDELVDCDHLCCMAHARAKFFYAWQTNKEQDARYMLDLIARLYELEKHYSRLNLSPEEIYRRRNNDETSEIVIMLRSKIDAMKAEGHPPRSELLDKAVCYLDSFWKQIMAYRKNGRYSIDNNIAERFIKPLVNERKNSLFHGSDRRADVSALYHTLISTCRQLKVSVTEYFGKLFAKIVRGCKDTASMLPMNMGLSVNNY